MDKFIVNIIHRPEMVPEYSATVTGQGKEEDIGDKALLTESLDIFKTQQRLAHENGLKVTIQMTYASLFNDEAVEIAKHDHEVYGDEIALSLLDVNEYTLLKATYKLNKMDIFLETMPPLRMIIRDTLVLLSGGKPVTQSEAPKKLQRKLTREKTLSLLDTIEKAQRMAKGNGNINLLSTWLCTELRRITWQK